jgi:hypothetical protein
MKEYRFLAIRPIYKIGKDALVSTIEQELKLYSPSVFHWYHKFKTSSKIFQLTIEKMNFKPIDHVKDLLNWKLCIILYNIYCLCKYHKLKEFTAEKILKLLKQKNKLQTMHGKLNYVEPHFQFHERLYWKLYHG